MEMIIVILIVAAALLYFNGSFARKLMRFSEKLKYSKLCDQICQTTML